LFGISDGLVTNVSLILGVAGAHPAGSFVRLAGLAGLVAGAFSMAAGEYVSMQAQRELLQRELDVERKALRQSPDSEHEELTAIYESRGLKPELAQEVAVEMMRDPDLALETHAREELGIDPSNLGSPVKAAASSFVMFALGALLPLLPWLFASGSTAILVSVVVGAAASLIVGGTLGLVTGRSPLRSALRQLALAALAAGVTYGIGRLVGVSGV
jgi:VIT1/CCC1 family predicted Fe2+/Mn2+ transporter